MRLPARRRNRGAWQPCQRRGRARARRAPCRARDARRARAPHSGKRSRDPSAATSGPYNASLSLDSNMQRLWRTLEVLAWAVFFLTAAAMLFLRYVALPQIERLRPEIVSRVSDVVGRRVGIGGIEARWLGLRPQINFTDVRIYDADGHEALVLPMIENILSWRSLARGRLTVHAVRIDEPRLTARRDAQGALYIAGIRLVATPGERGFSDWLFDQREIDVRNAQIEWRDEQRGAPPLVLSALNLRIDNQGAQHAASLTARLPESIGSTVELRAQLTSGDVDDRRAWNGRIYAETGTTDLAAGRVWLDYPADLERGQGALRAWATITDGELREATADLALTDVRAKLAPDLPTFALAGLAGRLHGRQNGDTYQLSAKALKLVPQNAPALPPVEFELAWSAAGGVVSANTLELVPLAHLGEALPLPAELRRVTRELEPRGQLAELRYEWQGPLAAPTRYRGATRFTDLAIKPREAVPGFSHLAGRAEVSDAGGRISLDAHGAELELPRVFPQPRLAFDALAGEASWRRDGARLQVEIPSLTFTNGDVSGNAFGSYARDGEGPGRIDLSAVLARADARSLPRYLPLGALMGEKTREWLIRAIVAGQASDVRLRLQGDLRQFPFVDPKQGDFRVSARVRNGLLDYTSGWPRVEAIDAELLFERNRMDIVGTSATTLGARLRDVHVSIAELGAKTSPVRISGAADGPTSEFFRFLSESPLRSSAGRFTDSMSASGNGRLQLKLELPLANLGATRIAGEYELDSNDIVLTRTLPPFEKTQGRVSFTESTVALRDVRASVFGGTVAIGGGTRAAGGLEFVARGDAQPAQLESFIDARLRRHLSGSASYVATVNMRDGLQRVLVESSLRGVASALPAPLDKPAGDALPLRVEYTPAEGGVRDRIAVSLGRLAAADIRRRRGGEGMELQRAALAFSPPTQPLRLPEQGLLVYGSAAAADLDRWRALFAGSGGGGGGVPTAVELRLARADLLGKRVHNLAVRASAGADGWSAVVDADELAGQVDYRTEGGARLVARLLHLAVPEATGDGDMAARKASDLPALDIVAERFSVRGKPLGRLELHAAPEGDDWRIDKLTLASPDAKIEASGRWRGGAASGSELKFTLNATDAGKFLGRVGYPDMVLGGKASLAGSLGWAGELPTLDYPSLSGDLKLSAEDGQFLEIEPGLGKLISLMNLQALPRRIALDFRDVFSKGFRFDRIDAVSRVEQGTMQLKQFHMAGPAAEVAMSGRVGLADETQALKVRVVPSLGGTASTAVAIVNPVAGVAAAIAQKVLKNPLGQIFSHEFDVSGSWTDPKVTKIIIEPTPNQAATP